MNTIKMDNQNRRIPNRKPIEATETPKSRTSELQGNNIEKPEPWRKWRDQVTGNDRAIQGAYKILGREPESRQELQRAIAWFIQDVLKETVKDTTYF